MGRGAEISQKLFEQAVRPIVEETIPGVGYLAGRLGSGSDVLGFDDETSADHDFGCRLTLLVDDEHDRRLADVDAALAAGLPVDVDGWPVRFPTSWDDRLSHNVDVLTVHGFAQSRLGFDLRMPLDAATWLCLTGQSVLEVTAGPVWHDTTNTFSTLVKALSWYPDDVWHFVLAAGWARLAQELPLVGRAGQTGDEAGSQMIASRLCRDITHLTFVVERAWAPYPKWVGAALVRLSNGSAVADQLASVQTAQDWRQRQARLGDAVEALAHRHRAAGLDLPSPILVPFFNRPFLTIADETAAALHSRIEDPDLRRLPPIGCIEQWCDNVDILTEPAMRKQARAIYRPTW